jgi:hypothetical protein
VNFLPGLVWNHDPSDLCFLRVARIASMNHQCLTLYYFLNDKYKYNGAINILYVSFP